MKSKKMVTVDIQGDDSLTADTLNKIRELFEFRLFSLRMNNLLLFMLILSLFVKTTSLIMVCILIGILMQWVIMAKGYKDRKLMHELLPTDELKSAYMKMRLDIISSCLIIYFYKEPKDDINGKFSFMWWYLTHPFMRKELFNYWGLGLPLAYAAAHASRIVATQLYTHKLPATIHPILFNTAMANQIMEAIKD